MCLVCYQPAGDSPFSEDILRNGWSVNHDGAGIMYVEDGKLVIDKPFYKLAELIKAYGNAYSRCGQTSPIVIHFRYSTHGDKGADNVHPHILAGGDAGLVHNGVLWEFEPPFTSTVSDTAWFCRTVLSCRNAEQLTSEAFGNVLSEMIGPHNKFVIMDSAGSVSIINPDAGVWDGGRWYSNRDYEKSIPIVAGIACSWPVDMGNWREDVHGDACTPTTPNLPWYDAEEHTTPEDQLDWEYDYLMEKWEEAEFVQDLEKMTVIEEQFELLDVKRRDLTITKA